MSRSKEQRNLDRRIRKRKTLRGIKPNESSATRDSMKATRRNWGDGKNIDENGNQDHERPEEEVI